ncbi:MAG: TRAP transporter small permease [Bacteroidota bacterium]
MSKKILKLLRKGMRYGTLLSALGLVLSVLIQIYGRFFLEASPPWTEEASRLFFIYTVAFGAAPALLDGYFVFLDLISKRLPVSWRKPLEQLVTFCIILVSGALAMYAWQFVVLGMAENSPGMHLPMAFAFFSMWLLFASLAVLPLLAWLGRTQKTKS